MESKIRIKATIPEMKAFFDKDVGVRYYEIKDKRYTQAQLEGMSEDRYNSEVFTFSVLYRHMELEKPLTGTFTIAGLTKKMDALRETDRLFHTPVYKNNAEHARENGELELYRASNKANSACKEAIEKAISEHYYDNVLHKEAVAQVAEQFGHERILYVLAITIRQKDWDGRFSADNKQWAMTVPIMENPDAWGTDRNCYLAVNSHSGLVDLFTSLAREDARTHERRPSVLGRLKSRPPETVKEAVKKAKEPSL